MTQLSEYFTAKFCLSSTKQNTERVNDFEACTSTLWPYSILGTLWDPSHRSHRVDGVYPRMYSSFLEHLRALFLKRKRH